MVNLEATKAIACKHVNKFKAGLPVCKVNKLPDVWLRGSVSFMRW